MAERVLPGSMGLTAEWPLGADNWKDGMDANLFLLSMCSQIVVKDVATSEPGSPEEGDAYIITTSGDIVVYDQAEWKTITAKEGWIAYVEANETVYVLKGGVWEVLLEGDSEIPTGGLTGQVLTKTGVGDDDYDWNDLPPGEPGEDGQDGASVELRVSGGYIQWRQDDNDPTWANLVSLDDITGPPGEGAIPTGGTARQLLVKQSATDGDADWESRRFKLPFFFTETPDADEILGIIIADEDFTIPANFAGDQYVKVGTNPTSTYVITLKDDGTNIGTISISTAGVATFATGGGTSKAVAKGSVLQFVGQTTPDATIANVGAMLWGLVG